MSSLASPQMSLTKLGLPAGLTSVGVVNLTSAAVTQGKAGGLVGIDFLEPLPTFSIGPNASSATSSGSLTLTTPTYQPLTLSATSTATGSLTLANALPVLMPLVMRPSAHVTNRGGRR
mgnify:CR=1 FL=1